MNIEYSKLSSNRQGIKIAGESGSLSTVGSMMINLLREQNYFIFSEREFPSLIKGGRASFNINYSGIPIRSMSEKFDIGVAFDREGLYECLSKLHDCTLVNGFDHYPKIFKTLEEDCNSKNIRLINIPVRQILNQLGAPAIMTNTVLIGALIGALSMEFTKLEFWIKDSLASKASLIPLNIECAKAGFDFLELHKTENKLNFQLIQPSPFDQKNNLLLDGNATLSLGAISAGVKAHYQYPMSPSTTVLVNLATWVEKLPTLGIVVKQVEDEISAVQMALGSMYGGIRALTATSGGGFDLMTETVSLSAMTEVPLVVINVQRPGPATGLPTWTAQADLNLVLHSGHGEYAKIIIGVSDQESGYELIQKAYNLTEKFQVPVIILSEATIAMSSKTVLENDLKNLEVERSVITNNQDLADFLNTNKPLESEALNTEEQEIKSQNRYMLTQTGVSPRWIPTTSEAVYYSNGDEHYGDGSLTEDGDQTMAMINKRITKNNSIFNELPEPILYGNINAKTTLVCWGSTKNAILDYIDLDDSKFNCLHYEFLFPLKFGIIKELINSGQNLILVEGNATGQLGELITSKTGFLFQQKFLKYNGRGFFLEDIEELVESLGL